MKYLELRFDPDQPRGKDGKWIAVGGGGSASVSESYGIPKKPSVTLRLTDEELSGKTKSTGNAEKGVDKTDESGIIKEIKDLGIKGEIHLSPKPVDTDKLTINSHHIVDRNHNVDYEEAVSYIKNAKISITKWNGQFENYYSKNGAAYVNLAENLIQTAFKSSEYDEKTANLMEVLDRYGR